MRKLSYHVCAESTNCSDVIPSHFRASLLGNFPSSIYALYSGNDACDTCEPVPITQDRLELFDISTPSFANTALASTSIGI